ncbi:unnamed protein product [Sphagnum troendelagicum]|uniref:Uncharacterized protein n=1 Tax=Sphagnum jensenii TaxID=128206 RepID=A0ABP0WQS4_9BRYO
MCIDSNYEMFGGTNSHDIDLSSAAPQEYDGYGSFFTLEWRWSAHPQWEYKDGANLPDLYVEGLQIGYKSQKQHAHYARACTGSTVDAQGGESRG